MRALPTTCRKGSQGASVKGRKKKNAKAGGNAVCVYYAQKKRMKKPE